MNYTVFFKEDNNVFAAPVYIEEQITEHRELLLSLVKMLGTTGSIQHKNAFKEANDDWTLLLKDQRGQLYQYTLFISQFEVEKEMTYIKTHAPQKELVIINSQGQSDSIGGEQPGYWSIEEYAAFLEPQAKELFFQTVGKIKNNIPDETYSINNDFSISIHIDNGKAYAISIHCVAKWV